MGDASLIERAVAATAAELVRQNRSKAIYLDLEDPRRAVIDGRVDLEAVVRAVFVAMREPTEAMMSDRVIRQAGYSGDVDEVWRMMIDAALSTKG